VIKCLGGNTTRTSPSKVVKDKTVLGLSDLLPAVLAGERTAQAASGKIPFYSSLFRELGILSADHPPWEIG
jgi:hypothetical protein